MKALFLLPREILYRIFKLLLYSDLKSISCVCKDLCIISNYPPLWKEFQLVVSHTPETILILTRFSSLKQLTLVDLFLSDKVLEIVHHLPLSYFSIDKCDLSRLSPKILSSCVATLKHFQLRVHNEYRCEEHLTEDQIFAIFSKLSSYSKLQVLQISFSDLSAVSPDVLAKVIGNLEVAELHWCLLTERQAEALFKQLEKSESKSLKQLDLGYNNLSTVPTSTMANVLNRLERVNVYNIMPKLTSSQVNHILLFITQGSQLSELNLGGANFQGIDIAEEIIGEAISRLDVVCLSLCELSKSQIEAIITAAATSTRLRGLYLTGSSIDMVDPHLLVKSVIRLQMVGLGLTDLTHIQVSLLLNRISIDKDCSIKQLDISNNDLSRVDAEILAKAVNNLESVGIHHTGISEYQIMKLLKQVINDSNLKDLNIGGDLRTISPDIIAESFNRLRSVTMFTESTLLSSKAMLDLFEKMSQNTKLTCMDFRYRDLTRIPVNILAKAVNNLVEVNLIGATLNDDQILAIFTEMAIGSKLRSLDIREVDLKCLSKQNFKAAKQRCRFILHDYDRDFSVRISRERIFGNKRKPGEAFSQEET